MTIVPKWFALLIEKKMYGGGVHNLLPPLVEIAEMSFRILREVEEQSFQHKLHLLTDCHETGNFGQRLPPTSFFTI